MMINQTYSNLNLNTTTNLCCGVVITNFDFEKGLYLLFFFIFFSSLNRVCACAIEKPIIQTTRKVK